MSFEPIGAIAIIAGVICLISGPRISAPIFACFCLLGASAAAILSAMGGANISPAHILLLILCLDLATRPEFFQHALYSLRFPNTGFWLLILVAYGAALTIIMPRLFAGETYVFVPARSDDGVAGIMILPLGPTSANLTQTGYLIADLICFCIFYSYGRLRSSGAHIIWTGLCCGALNLFFAAIDIITYYSNTAELLGFMRNATYRMLDDAETAGIKRIVGSFTEASSFASVTLALLAFNLRLWREGVIVWLSGPISLVSFIALISATSSTGYVGLAIFIILQLCFSCVGLLRKRAAPNTIFMFALLPTAMVAVACLIALDDRSLVFVQNLMNATLFEKLGSDSGIERGAWNRQAIVSIQDTLGLGAGIGSLRASSWLVAVPASVGIIGSILCIMFVFRIFKNGTTVSDLTEYVSQKACQDFCLSSLITASLSASFVDLGPLFFAFAGMASSLGVTITSGQPCQSQYSVGRGIGRRKSNDLNN